MVDDGGKEEVRWAMWLRRAGWESTHDRADVGQSECGIQDPVPTVAMFLRKRETALRRGGSLTYAEIRRGDALGRTSAWPPA